MGILQFPFCFLMVFYKQKKVPSSLLEEGTPVYRNIKYYSDVCADYCSTI